LSLKTSDGNTLSGIHFPPTEQPTTRTLILGFGGNAWNAQDVATYLREIFPKADVVVFHYRGYAPSTGSPSAEALIADAPLVYDLASDLLKPRETIAVGFSIGSGIAAQLASRRTLNGLILVTPFDSLKAVAEAMYPWLPIGAIFSHEIDSATPLENSGVPTAILAAANDEIVPSMRTDALRARVPNLVFDRTIARAGHNDIYSRLEFQEAMREALDTVAG
jgi:pimeloyl-ACP methyl ester carboxylesterase